MQMEATHTWHQLFSILAWMIADADAARRTLDHAADELEGAADRLAANATDAPPVRCLLRRYVLDIARDRVAALRSEDPRPVPDAAPARPRPNRGLLVNLKNGIDLVLASQPSAVMMRAFAMRDPRHKTRHLWYPAWLAGVQSAVDNAVRRLSRARSELEAVCLDVDELLAVAAPAHSQGAAGVCAAVARHARRGVANLDALVHILRVLEDELEDEPPTARVMQFFGYVLPPPSPPAIDAGAGGGAAAAAGDDADAGRH